MIIPIFSPFHPFWRCKDVVNSMASASTASAPHDSVVVFLVGDNNPLLSQHLPKQLPPHIAFQLERQGSSTVFTEMYSKFRDNLTSDQLTMIKGPIKRLVTKSAFSTLRKELGSSVSAFLFDSNLRFKSVATYAKGGMMLVPIFTDADADPGPPTDAQLLATNDRVLCLKADTYKSATVLVMSTPGLADPWYALVRSEDNLHQALLGFGRAVGLSDVHVEGASCAAAYALDLNAHRTNTDTTQLIGVDMDPDTIIPIVRTLHVKYLIR